ncbi:MAG: 16S rRNA (guanine(527)-N(7))-methyltransferase RsmG [Nitrospinae bacterium]|nr:16S rRNA (guanine(527)-N(7))-methyltransferase RsmG [Nitrospinota bacterium]
MRPVSSSKAKTIEILGHPGLGLDASAQSPDKVEKMLAFLAEWGKWSRKIDLTSEDDPQAVLEKHVFDSLQYARALRGRCPEILDIGSGAGFPGIPLKIIFPDYPMTLVESRRKRANFLQAVARSLALPRLEVVNARAEELLQKEGYAGRFDYIVFKAVAPMAECLEMGFPFLKTGGRIVIKKETDTASPSLPVTEEIPIQSYHGIPSKLMIFEKCST